MRPSIRRRWSTGCRLLAQVGTNNFTAQVSDGQGHTAATTFQVTVVHVNQPPQLKPQADATMDIGTTFTRTLIATDPDAGDVLTYSLVSGPTGMTLTGDRSELADSGAGCRRLRGDR